DQLLKEHGGSLLNLCMCHLVKRTPMKPFVRYKSWARILHHIHVLVVQLLQPVSTVEVAEALLQLSQCVKDVPDIMCTQDKGIQVDVDSIIGKQFRRVDMLTSDNTVLAFTGVSSMTALVAISNEVSSS
ncbi:hypothetical protein MRX96_048695, partial [Rhipicephalus microplus]